MDHFAKYYPSLKNYPEKYQPLFFNPGAVVTDHMAYLCPLCLKNGMILFEDLFADTRSKFSLDHFPPESVGGFLTVVVCKKCNNDAGGQYEHALKELIQTMSLNNRTPGAKVKGKMEIEGLTGRYASSIEVRDDGEFVISFKPNLKAHVPHLDDWLDKSADENKWKADLTIPQADEKKISKSLLKAAYLHCFERWGYEFSYSYTGEMIRNVLLGIDEYPILNPSFWLGNIPNAGRLPLGVCYLRQPTALRCFIVNMEVKDQTTNYRNLASVLIPGPAEKDWDKLLLIKDQLESNSSHTLSMAHVTDNMLFYGITDGYHKSYAELNS
ncbi:MAG: hypothetical protein JWR67_3038 [Mucilaginibacter sp.]|nr:hypothetical protein [Mucilaginibacter sp.]